MFVGSVQPCSFGPMVHRIMAEVLSANTAIVPSFVGHDMPLHIGPHDLGHIVIEVKRALGLPRGIRTSGNLVEGLWLSPFKISDLY